MCLYNITKINEIPDPTHRIGYKVLHDESHVEDGVFCSWLMPAAGREIPTNVWLNPKRDQIRVEQLFGKGPFFYDAGFHVFVNAKDAERYAGPKEPIVRVVYRNVTTIGYQFVGGLNNQLGVSEVASQIFYPRDQTLTNDDMLRLAKETSEEAEWYLRGYRRKDT